MIILVVLYEGQHFMSRKLRTVNIFLTIVGCGKESQYIPRNTAPRNDKQPVTQVMHILA